MTGPAQTRATPNDVRTVPGPSPGGRFNSAFPLWDGTNRILVDLDAVPAARCRRRHHHRAVHGRRACEDPDAQAAPPSLQRVDVRSRTEHAAADHDAGRRRHGHGRGRRAAAHAARRCILDRDDRASTSTPTCVSEGVGILDIRSVYDFDGVDHRGTPNIAARRDPAQTHGCAAPRPLPPRRESRSRMPDDDVRDIDNAAFGVTQLHARDPRLRADRAGRLGSV